ncbi:unnamed protein product [Spodoptera exigua]|nr:unnamed protein product [Spodoptera exigua]
MDLKFLLLCFVLYLCNLVSCQDEDYRRRPDAFYGGCINGTVRMPDGAKSFSNSSNIAIVLYAFTCIDADGAIATATFVHIIWSAPVAGVLAADEIAQVQHKAKQ